MLDKYKKLGLKLFIKECIKFFYKKLNNFFGKNVPVQASLYMSELCNFKCEGCRRSVVGHNKKGFLELDDVKLLLKKYPTLKSFTLAGLGEPTLSKHFSDIVNYLSSMNKSVLVITNGTNAKQFEDIEDKNIKISISLYGLNNQAYEKYTHTSFYEKVIGNYKILREKFNHVGFSYIISRTNYNELEELVKLTDELKPEFLNLYNYLVYAPENEEEKAKTVTKDDVEIISKVNEVRKNRGYVSELTIADFDKDCYTCDSYGKVINLAPDGGIGGCRRQVPPSLKYGNIYKDKNPYNSKVMNNLRKKIKCGEYPHEECKYCFGRFDNVK